MLGRSTPILQACRYRCVLQQTFKLKYLRLLQYGIPVGVISFRSLRSGPSSGSSEECAASCPYDYCPRPDTSFADRCLALQLVRSKVDVQAVARFQLIVATDSEALLREISSWKSSNQLRRSLDVGESGERDILVDLLDQTETLSKLGIQVMWSRVSERWNRPARKLAADAVIGHCVRLEGRKPSFITEAYC